MSAADVRKQKILLQLNEKERISVSQIQKEFSVSSATARRICNQLAEEGKVRRFHGYIEKVKGRIEGYDFDKAMDEGYCEKKRISRYAASLLKDEDKIFLETGTSVLECAFAIRERIAAKNLSNIHVYTNYIPVLEILGDSCETSIVGGVYQPSAKKVNGYLTRRALENIYFDYSFIGCDGISLEKGIMTHKIEDGMFLEPLIAHTKKVIVVAHSEKFFQNSFISFMPCNKVNLIITDTGLPENETDLYISRGVQLTRV